MSLSSVSSGCSFLHRPLQAPPLHVPLARPSSFTTASASASAYVSPPPTSSMGPYNTSRALSKSPSRCYTNKAVPRLDLNLGNWFPTQQKLKEKNELPTPHFVYLEGDPGAAKRDIIWRLSRLGYNVYEDHFLGYCERAWEDSSSLTKLSSAWIASQNAFVEDLEETCAKKKVVGDRSSDNIVFLHRSPLSLVIHGKILGNKEMEEEGRRHLEINAGRNSSYLYCHADPIRQGERLAERIFDADRYNKVVMQKVLGMVQDYDDEKLAVIRDAYRESQQEGNVFAADIDTTSAKQAAANILTQCGIEFKPVFDLEKLRATTTSRNRYSNDT
eukprot:TRINITY_DN321_c0_g1_i2.p1 TRINITY_DN321_c0_g1~~TRINITY_DN321_c0_g1_i2.p1  ORF type:complete len:359 (-),score=75.30 TRINITY_DN321_c0_g1_i2:83-1072(-)